MNQYKELEFIGRGNFGTVHLVEHIESKELYVVKKIPTQLLSTKEVQQAHREVELLAQLHHPNVVEFKESFESNDNVIHIIMAYCKGGDLAGRIQAQCEKDETKKFFPMPQILDWFIQMIMAIKYLHDNHILHRDLKTSNIFLSKENVIKLGDFGIAKPLASTLEHAKTVVGTPYYMSPEVCESKPYSYASDVWALGCVLYELCALRYAFEAKNILCLAMKIVQQDTLPLPDHVDPQVVTLINQMLDKSPSKRPTIPQIFQMPFIRNHMASMAISGSYLSRGMPLAKLPLQALKRTIRRKYPLKQTTGITANYCASSSSTVESIPSSTTGIRIKPYRDTKKEIIVDGDKSDGQLVPVLVKSNYSENVVNDYVIPPTDNSKILHIQRKEVHNMNKESTKATFMSTGVIETSVGMHGKKARKNAWEPNTKIEEPGSGDPLHISTNFEFEESINPNFESVYTQECEDSLQIVYSYGKRSIYIDDKASNYVGGEIRTSSTTLKPPRKQKRYKPRREAGLLKAQGLETSYQLACPDEQRILTILPVESVVENESNLHRAQNGTLLIHSIKNKRKQSNVGFALQDLPGDKNHTSSIENYNGEIVDELSDNESLTGEGVDRNYYSDYEDETCQIRFSRSLSVSRYSEDFELQVMYDSEDDDYCDDHFDSEDEAHNTEGTEVIEYSNDEFEMEGEGERRTEMFWRQLQEKMSLDLKHPSTDSDTTRNETQWVMQNVVENLLECKENFHYSDSAVATR